MTTQIAFLSALFSSRDGITAALNLRCHNDESMEISIVHDSVLGYRAYEFRGGETLMAIQVQDHETLAIAAKVESETVASGVYEVDLGLIDTWGKLLIPQNVSRIELGQDDAYLVDYKVVPLDEAIRVVDQQLMEVSRC